MPLAEHIRSIRKARNMSQEAVAYRAGMSLRAYRRLERGEAVDPHISTVRKLSEALDVSPYALLGAQLAVPLAPAPPDTKEVEARHDTMFLSAIKPIVVARVTRLLQEVDDSNSPHFRNATTATLWVADVKNEAGDLVASEIAKAVAAEDKRSIMMLLGVLTEYGRVSRRAQARIDGMDDMPDEFSMKRDQSAQRRLISLQEVA